MISPRGEMIVRGAGDRQVRAEILDGKRIYHALFRHAIARSRRRWVLGLPSGGLADRPELAEASGWRRPSVGHGLPGYGIVPASG